MRNIQDCVSAFATLIDTEYEIILGRKGIAVTLRICTLVNDVTPTFEK